MHEYTGRWLFQEIFPTTNIGAYCFLVYGDEQYLIGIFGKNEM